MPTQESAKDRFTARYSQFFQLSTQFADTPTVLACQPQDQPFKVSIGSRTSASISHGGIRPFLAHEFTMPAQQGVWLEQQQDIAQLLANRQPSLSETGNEGNEQELFERREGQSPLLTTVNNGKLLAYEQDFKVFLIERLPNDVQNVEQKPNELVK